MGQHEINPWAPFPAQEQLFQQVRGFYNAHEHEGLKSLIAAKFEHIRHFDITGMDRGAAICACGRSGSILLASYLDGHHDIIMLPGDRSIRMYEFFECYPSLSLYEKLISYPVFTQFFHGEFSIDAAEYYAAVKAIFEMYGNHPPEFLGSRRSFVRFLHVAYCVALGRRPATRQPLIVYALHNWNDKSARRFVEDFPQARFIHTVRDPITSLSRGFDTWWGGQGISTARYLIRDYTRSDKPHTGMELRTRAIRFEDLHLHLEKTMRAVADWLDLPYHSSLLESTFNGVRWMVRRKETSWSGPRPDQAIRDSQHISSIDRSLIFAVFNEDFVAWNYSCPTVFKHSFVRISVCVLLLLVPMKMEFVIAYRLIKTLPSVQWRDFRFTIRVINPDGATTKLEGSIIQAAGSMLTGRLAIIAFLARDLFGRLALGKKVLDLL
jgi:hypothetical protein